MTHMLQRADLQLIADLVEPGCRVLDAGCGDGFLLHHLKENKNIDGRGVEIKQNKVNTAVAKGLAVIQGDAEEELTQYPDRSFDYVILSQTVPATAHPQEMLRQVGRVGKRGLISFPNFGYWKVRLHLLFKGTMPVTRALSRPWYLTENIHLCTVTDFLALARDTGLIIEKSFGIANNKHFPAPQSDAFFNLYAEEAVFLLKSV